MSYHNSPKLSTPMDKSQEVAATRTKELNKQQAADVLNRLAIMYPTVSSVRRVSKIA